MPSVVITVADIPAPLKEAISSRIAWNSAACFFETGSSLMSANASIGKAEPSVPLVVGASPGAVTPEALVTGAAGGGASASLADVHAPSVSTAASANQRPLVAPV